MQDSSNNINSDLLKLKQLEVQYRTKLEEYKMAYATYNTTIQSQSKNSNTFVVLPGQIYVGSGSVSDKDNANSSLENCEALCSSDKTCRGANFNSISGVCKLKTSNGVGKLSAGATSDNAIITKTTQQLIYLDSINSQLIEINSQMNDIIEKIQPFINSNLNKEIINNENLIKNNEELIKEQNKIKKLLDEYNDVNQNYIDQSLTADQKNATYYLWLVIASLIVFLTGKFVLFPESRGNLVSIFLITLLITSIIFATINMNNPAIYAIWISLVAIVIMIKAQLIPII